MRLPQSPVDDLTGAGRRVRRALGRRTGTFLCPSGSMGIEKPAACRPEESAMNGIIYLVGLIVVIMFILSFLGLR